MSKTEELYHNCRWCKYYSQGDCLRSSEVFYSSVNVDLFNLVESGKISEAIQEGLTLPKLRKLENFLSGSNLSKKLQKEILQTVGAELEECIPTMVEGINDSVGKVICNLEIGTKDLELKDPESFYCKHFE